MPKGQSVRNKAKRDEADRLAGKDTVKKSLNNQNVYPKIKSYDPKVWYGAFNKLYDDKDIEGIANALLIWAKEKIETKDHLLIGDFAIEFMLPEARFPEFSRKVPYFAFVYNLVKKMQEQYFAKRGLVKEGNPAMEIFLLKSIHKYMEESKVKMHMLDLSKLTTEQLQMVANGATIEEVLLNKGDE